MRKRRFFFFWGRNSNLGQDAEGYIYKKGQVVSEEIFFFAAASEETRCVFFFFFFFFPKEHDGSEEPLIVTFQGRLCP